MKYSSHLYARALVEASEHPNADDSKIAKNFLVLVAKNGDEGRLRNVIEEAGRILRASLGIRSVVVESARPLGKAQEKNIQPFLKPSDIVEYKVNPELAAGIKIVLDEELQFDESLKGKLDRLFGDN